MSVVERIDRKACKAQARELLDTAQVSPQKMTALWLVATAVLSLIGDVKIGSNAFYVFQWVLSIMLSLTLRAGFVLYCMAIRRGERAEYLTLFDGFSFAWKIILLTLVTYAFIILWGMLFVVPGFIAFYRYRFALYNLLENPDIGIFQAIRMSKRQTSGLKGQLFVLDLTYVGWAILAVLPRMVYQQVIQIQLFSIVGTNAYWNPWEVAQYVNADVFGIPAMAWQFLQLVWGIVVAMFYIAHYQCVDLAYFETAKGVSAAAYADSYGEEP